MTATQPSVLAVVPAHNEAEDIGTCLAALGAALSRARRVGLVGRTMIAVSAHRCTDGTSLAARAALSGLTELESCLIADLEPGPVGAVRSRLVEHAVANFGLTAPERSDTWLFSTDADTVVPQTWIADIFGAARCGDNDAPGAHEAHDAGSAAAVAGLVDLTPWSDDPVAHARYDDVIRAGMLVGGGHRHVYAANLAVRLSAYQAVGGFPALAHGEEHGLVAALRQHGFRVSTPTDVRVLTSGRMPGRAMGGLSTLLGSLADNLEPLATPAPQADSPLSGPVPVR